ncbi:hypothetical protein T09_9120 [Trichinella sp. T9]|nr:hypothetical protein T09_9120 [Trichinella sp. T9]
MNERKKKENDTYRLNNIQNCIIMNGMNRLLTGMINEQHILQQSVAFYLSSYNKVEEEVERETERFLELKNGNIRIL